MPTYQYRCTECGHDLEAVQKFTDAALTECPSCGGQLRKVYNAVGVVFKGSGFYRTDSRKAPSEGSDGGSGGAGEKASDGAGTKESGGQGSGGKDSGGKESGTTSGSGGSEKKASSTPSPSGTSAGSSSSTTGKAAAS